MPIADAEFRLSSTTINAKPIKRSLMDIAPNPASKEVYIAYQLPDKYHIAILEIHNAIGQTVALIDISNHRHVFKIDVEAYTPGIYLVSLIVDGYVIETSKLNILKN